MSSVASTRKRLSRHGSSPLFDLAVIVAVLATDLAKKINSNHLDPRTAELHFCFFFLVEKLCPPQSQSHNSPQ